MISFNEPFTLAEVEFQIRNSINNKSSGIDGIPAEFYKNSLNNITPFLVLLCTRIFDSGYFPKTWGQSIICPIHKSGPTHNLGNYRGISVTNIMYKIFAGILNKRLYEWAEGNNKFDESQAGFRAGYSAIDNVFCLQAMAKKYLSKMGVDSIAYIKTLKRHLIK